MDAERTADAEGAGLTPAQRSALRKRLEEERAAALDLLAGAEVDARLAEELPEPMDAAELSREQGDGALQVARARVRLREVERALEKMRAGTYGLSERSGLPIGYRRLEAVPWTRLAVDEEDGADEADRDQGPRP